MSVGETQLPTPKAVRDLFSGIVGREIDLSVDGEALTPATEPGVLVGEYISDVYGAQALVAFDLPLAAYLGAALALVPPGGAQIAVDEAFLPDSLLDNAYEVLNISASLFNTDNAPHLRLDPVYDSARSPLPANIATWLRGYVPRLDAAVSVRGYGDGRLSILLK